MGSVEIRRVANTLLAESQAIVAAFTRQRDLATLPLSDASLRMESFGNRLDEANWLELRGLYIVTRRARERNVDDYIQLRDRMPLIQQFVRSL